jgi:hypothetical protein
MLALERLDAWTPQLSRASLRLRAEGLYFEQGRFRPLWCVELMAQAAAAGVAYGAAVAADEPREAAGFLVGVEDLRFGALRALSPGARARDRVEAGRRGFSGGGAVCADPRRSAGGGLGAAADARRRRPGPAQRPEPPGSRASTAAPSRPPPAP